MNYNNKLDETNIYNILEKQKNKIMQTRKYFSDLKNGMQFV